MKRIKKTYNQDLHRCNSVCFDIIKLVDGTEEKYITYFWVNLSDFESYKDFAKAIYNYIGTLEGVNSFNLLLSEYSDDMAGVCVDVATPEGFLDYWNK